MKDNFKEQFFSKIKKEEIKPISPKYFENKNRFIWIFIGILVLFGILFGGFLINDSQELFQMRGHMGGNIGFLFIPNIFWIILISIFIFIGIKSFKNTPIGYRNSYLKDFLVLIVIIFLGSFLFRGIGLGATMHSFMIEKVPGISNFLYNESSWDDVENGRLAGTILEINNDYIKLNSISGKIWTINIKKSFISPMAELNINEKIRVLGEISGTGAFIGEKIMPRFGKGMGMGGKGHGRGMMRGY